MPLYLAIISGFLKSQQSAGSCQVYQISIVYSIQRMFWSFNLSSRTSMIHPSTKLCPTLGAIRSQYSKQGETGSKPRRSNLPRCLFCATGSFFALVSACMKYSTRFAGSRGITALWTLLRKRIVCKPFVRNHMWIDAICIDQSNLEERSSQVKMMHLIYKKADAVLVWLGPQDEVATQAVRAMDKLNKAPELATQTLRLSEQDRSTVYQAAMHLPMHEFDWYCLVSLLQRRWFRRAWIIQEVAWARMAIVVCGNGLWFDWSVLLGVSNWMTENTKDMDVWVMPWIRGSVTFFKPPGYSRQHSSELIIHTIRSMGNIHCEVRKDDATLTVREGVKKSSLLEILIRFWKNECSDPRDKVYALFSLCQDQTVLPCRLLKVRGRSLYGNG
jgi:hypothetical protein